MKYLLETLFSDVAGVVNIEVVKCKPEILLGKSLLLINSGGKEDAVVDVPFSILVESLEYFFKVALRQMNFFECFSDFSSS